MFDSFRNPDIAKSIADEISQHAAKLGNINLMEVCGTHTHEIAKTGIKNLLPKNVNLLSGPGCPVCVTPNNHIDKMIELSKNEKVIIATFGDMVRVPGSQTSLLEQQACYANIEIVYSPLDALKIAQLNKDKEIVFLGVGFETTTPTTAATILRAKEIGIKNFSLFCAHKNMPNALRTIASDNQVEINGLILPGHVSSIIGTRPYDFLPKDFNIPGVVSGFEPVDILKAINMLVIQITENKSRIENAYSRAVSSNGNAQAQSYIEQVFDVCDSQWRGLGTIQQSGYKIKNAYAAFDAEKKLNIPDVASKENKACKCGDVLRGKIKPENCPLFGKTCNPQNPIGPCMVSTEGSCSAAYLYSS